MAKKKNIIWYENISSKDVPLVGGKNASLGEMYNQLTKKGINIPDGFSLTSSAYKYFSKENKIDKKLEKNLLELKKDDISNLQKIGQKARSLILKSKYPIDLEKEIIITYKELEKKYGKNISVAVRSSGVAEDQPSASFAGQFETFLNISGEKNLLRAIKQCFASAFNDRVIAYREEKKIDHLKFGLSVGVQKMVRSDLASSGIMFTLDTETGFPNVILINSIWGIGEMIVKGQVTPDEFYVFKPTLNKENKPIIIKNLGRKTKKYIYQKNGIKETKVSEKDQSFFSINDEDILILANWAKIIEEHYGIPQDIEWAKDGKTKQLFIVQSRPETVHLAKNKNQPYYEEYKIKSSKPAILKGIAVGNKIGQGHVKIIPDIKDINKFRKGEILVTKMTDPDWVSVFPMASAIITEEGGKTCHAAIVSRELGVPCIVGAKDATTKLRNKQLITVDCTQGLNGKIFNGKIPFKVKKYNLAKIPKTNTKIMMNVGAPEVAFKHSFLPNDGIGLARIEFILAEKIKIHPLALYYYDQIKNNKIKKEIADITIEHKDKKEHFIKELAEGIAQIASSVYPKPTIVRLSDLKTNEYKSLIGGELYEPEESNPMIGWRGASRYLTPEFKPAFEMECKALKRVIEIFGLNNICLMIPFCRTIEEAKKVLELMKNNGLEKGKNGLKIIVMCEIPSNVILIDQFLDIFDGVSIGSNDLTQLVLGLDRDSSIISKTGDERNQAVKEMIKKVIQACKKRNKYCGICGEAPSTFPEFAEFLVNEGIDSISLNPDSIIKTSIMLSKKEKELKNN